MIKVKEENKKADLKLNIQKPKIIYIFKQNKNLKRYIHPNIHCSIIYYSQAMEVIKVSINT